MRLIATIAALLVALPAAAQVSNPPAVTVDTSQFATKAEATAAKNAADAAASAAASAVKSVNGVTPTAGNVAVAVPTPSGIVPPSVSDSGAAGTMTTIYALANHTHASKVRKTISSTAADGTLTWTYPTPFTTGTLPVCLAVAEVASGVTDVINVQLVGSPTATAATFLVNRTQRSVAALLGLTILSVPASPGVTKIHAVCLEP